MKINKFIAVVITFSIVFLGCDNFVTFSVKIDEEAVITQGEKIVGNVIGPGVHYKIPLFQKAHIIKKHMVRKLRFDSSSHKNIEIEVMWNVSDSIKYFLFVRDKNDEEVKTVLIVKTEETLSLFNDLIIQQIVMTQEKNPQSVDQNSLVILKRVQNAIAQFGINLYFIAYHLSVS